MMSRRIFAGAVEQRSCPGCGLSMPADPRAAYEGYYHTSPECWSVFAEVLGREYGDPVLMGGVHPLTVDAYAVQHAGGSHPDRSVGIHLAGLYVSLECGMTTAYVRSVHRRLAEAVTRWPRFRVPRVEWRLTIFDVAVCGANDEYMETVRRWAEDVWSAWSEHHAAVAGLVTRHVPLPVSVPAEGSSRSRDRARLH